MRSYPKTEENILFGEFEPRVARARKLCASARYPFGWLRFDSCAELPRAKKGSKVPEPVQSSRDVSRFFHESVPFAGRGREFLLVLCMDTKNVPLAVANPHVGGRSSAVVDPVSVFRPVVLSNASAFILAHNHPSGVPTPSPEDMLMTEKLVEGSKLLQVHMLDHVILTDDQDKYFSLLDKGMMPK